MASWNIGDLRDELSEDSIYEEQYRVIVELDDKQYDGFMLDDDQEGEVITLIVDPETEDLPPHT